MILKRLFASDPILAERDQDTRALSPPWVIAGLVVRIEMHRGLTAL
jgi:hypothetical protein